MRPFTIKPRAAALKRALCTLGLACASMAQANVVTFDTEVVQVACTPDLDNSGSPSATIPLPEIKASALGKTVGTTAGETTFTIGLSSCGDKIPAGTLAGAYFYGVEASTWDELNGVWQGRLTGVSSDGGSGWTYQLLRGSGSDDQIFVHTSAAKPSDAVLATLPNVDVSSGSGVLSYRVRYYHRRVGGNYDSRVPAKVNPGTRTAEATYVIYYR